MKYVLLLSLTMLMPSMPGKTSFEHALIDGITKTTSKPGIDGIMNLIYSLYEQSCRIYNSISYNAFKYMSLALMIMVNNKKRLS